MSIIPKQIGWSQESNLIWEVLRQLDQLTKVTSTGGGGGGTNPTATYIPYKSTGGIFQDSYLTNDTTNSVLKSVYGGNDIGLKLDFANNIYSFGDETAIRFLLNNNTGNIVIGDPDYIFNGVALRVNSDLNLPKISTEYQNSEIGIKLDFNLNQYLLFANDFGLSIDASNRFLSFGDYPYTNNGTTLNVDDVSQTIKTQNQGNDIGLKLDFAAGTFTLGDFGELNNKTWLGVDDGNQRLFASDNLFFSATFSYTGRNIPIFIDGATYYIPLYS